MIRRSIRLLHLFVVFTTAGCNWGPTALTLVEPHLDLDREVAEHIAEIFEQSHLIRVTLVDSPDGDQSPLELLASGAADLALVSNLEQYRPAITTVAPLYPTVLHIAYRAELQINDEVDVLRGRAVYAGPPGSVERIMLEEAAGRLGLEPGNIDYVEYEQCADVMVVYAPLLPDIPDRIAPCGHYRLFSLGDPADLGRGVGVDSFTILNPNVKPFVIPEHTYDDLTPKPVLTLAVHKLLVARKNVSSTAIYDLLSELLRLQPALAAAQPTLFHQLSDNFESRDVTFVLHPGTAAYLTRNEPGFYERYSGVAEVVLTLIIGLISGTYAMIRVINIRRKNRIDTFYTRAMGIRDRVRQASEPALAVEGAMTDLELLRDEAYEMLIREKLTADESFRIFIRLADNIKEELHHLQKV